MATYKLTVVKSITYDIIVQAKDESEAEDMALMREGEVVREQTYKVEFFDIKEIEEDSEPAWIERHSVNCIKCGVLFDEREGVTPEDGEGTLCPSCNQED